MGGRNLLGLAILALATLPTCSGSTPASDTGFHPRGRQLEDIGIAFPGLGSRRAMEFVRKHLRALHVSRIRIQCSWAGTEPDRGGFDWSTLDGKLELAQKEGLSLLLTVQTKTPGWACHPLRRRNEQSCVVRDETDFERYVTALLAHVQRAYPGVVDKIQLGNEWASRFHFIDSKDAYVALNNMLYRKVREISPGMKVVLGSFSAGQVSIFAACAEKLDAVRVTPEKILFKSELDRMCREDARTLEIGDRIRYALANARFDMIDIHLYSDPEHWPLYARVIRSVAGGQPIIVSEFGGTPPREEGVSDQLHAYRLVQSIRALERMGASEAYHFRLVSSPPGGGRGFPAGGLMKRTPSDAEPRRPSYDLVKDYNQHHGARLRPAPAGEPGR